ncbi:cohesin subunit sa-1 [Hordeum vulgare]|nr:cohesin subunit sa-1 [Hordeum vulgare]
MPPREGIEMGFQFLLEFIAMDRRKRERQRGLGKWRWIDMENKGKEVVPPMEQDKGKDLVSPSKVTPFQVPPMHDDVSEEAPRDKCKSYEQYHEEGGPTYMCKVIMAPQLDAIPMPLDFTKHFPSIWEEFKPKTNTGYSWMVIVRLLNLVSLTLKVGPLSPLSIRSRSAT